MTETPRKYQSEQESVWTRLREPLPTSMISWRQDGRPIQRDGKFFARFVAYIDANTARERLDNVVPGEWDLTLSELPAPPGATDDHEEVLVYFKARLQILGVIRENVGAGRDYKAAATDAFKRAAVQFGIGSELYDFEHNWVQVDGEGKYAKPLEDPWAAYERVMARKAERAVRETREIAERPLDQQSAAERLAKVDAEVPHCPKCGGRMWDNRLTKRNPKAPDFKCRDRACDGVVWPAGSKQEKSRAVDAGPLVDDGAPPPDESQAFTGDDLPF